MISRRAVDDIGCWFVGEVYIEELYSLSQMRVETDLYTTHEVIPINKKVQCVV